MATKPWAIGASSRISGDEFTVGSAQPGTRRHEQPAPKVTVDGFWLDDQNVPCAEFWKFVDATGHKTKAERPVDWGALKKQLAPGTPKPQEEMLNAGSMVFTLPAGSVDLPDRKGWWQWTTGANWQHPEGPHRNLDLRDDHPVVQVSWDDAVAYAKWAGKLLPTEEEWEFAARGGLENKRFAWDDGFKPGGRFMVNTWTGEFPRSNTKEDGFERTSPAKSFPPNGYGLYDMGGDVWNWVSDWYRPDAHVQSAAELSFHNPTGPKGISSQQPVPAGACDQGPRSSATSITARVIVPPHAAAHGPTPA